MHYYVSHLTGRMFSTSEVLTYDQRYCETCGDTDSYLGFFNTEEEAKAVYEEQDNCHEEVGEEEK